MRCVINIIRLVSCLFFLGTVNVCALAQKQPVDTSFYANFPFIRITNTESGVPAVSDDEFFLSAAGVVFQAGKSTLPVTSEFLRLMEQTVIPRLNRDSMQLLKVIMRGAASPEGSFEMNRQLGEKRAQALLTFLTERMQYPVADDVLVMGNDVEDYRSLCLLMRNAGDDDYELVQKLCDEHLTKSGPAVLKQQLQRTQGGRLWQRLLTQYFPQLRTARLMLCFRKYVPEKVEIQELKPVVVAKVDTVVIEKMDAVEIEIEPAPVVTDTVTFVEPSVLPRRELLSVKTNLLFYAAYIPGYDRWCPIPNIALEYYPKRGHFTYGFSFDMPWWQDYDAHKYFQIRNYQLEARYYLKGSTDLSSLTPHPSPLYSGFYLSAYGHLGVFGICFDADRGWVGEGAGGGLGFGYVTPISKNGHWRLEFGLQAGFFRCKYDPYQYENPIDPDYTDNLYYYKWTLSPDLFKKRQYRWNWIGPTRIGITLTYDLLYRRNNKGGMSLKNKEKVEY